MPQLDNSEFEASVNRYLNKVKRDIFDEVAKAANETRNEAIRKTPVDTGNLRAGWKVRINRGPNSMEAVVKNEVKYARSIEYGTKPRTIRAKNKKVLANRKTGKVFGKKVRHPGTKARPMLRPAIAKVVPMLKSRIRRLGN